MDFNIEQIIEEMDFSKNSLNDCGNSIFLTNYEITVLEKYNISYKNCTCLKEIIFMIEEILLLDNTLDDLDNISKSISERDYYLNTNK